MSWLYKAKKNYDLIILNYMATSNHTHLLVYNHGGGLLMLYPNPFNYPDTGRTGQEYNHSKKEKWGFLAGSLSCHCGGNR